jgi:acetyltransferase-like isoleucine patch superfamily enzyme
MNSPNARSCSRRSISLPPRSDDRARSRCAPRRVVRARCRPCPSDQSVLMWPQLIAGIRTRLAQTIVRLRWSYFVHLWKMDIGEGTRISLTAKLDKTNPCGVHIGRNTSIAFRATLLAHDFVNNRHCDVHIGDNCFIGANAMILPGVTVGNNCIVSAGSVVMLNVPAKTLVAGNPARVVESNIETGPLGIRVRNRELV